MPEITLLLKNKVGLHARPAAVFAQTAGGFESAITVRSGEAAANGKSVLQILALGAGAGSEVTIAAEGPDAAQALRALEELVASDFGEAP
jgi:phosphotransferase system HPr (HPr) family protein